MLQCSLVSHFMLFRETESQILGAIRFILKHWVYCFFAVVFRWSRYCRWQIRRRSWTRRRMSCVRWQSTWLFSAANMTRWKPSRSSWRVTKCYLPNNCGLNKTSLPKLKRCCLLFVLRSAHFCIFKNLCFVMLLVAHRMGYGGILFLVSLCMRAAYGHAGRGIL